MRSSFLFYDYECGLDEAGRGSLAGPLFTAAVILPTDFKHDGINDSKKLTPKKRSELVDVIKSESLAYAIDLANVNEIDDRNVLWATIASMHRCLDKISSKCKIEHIIIDGDRFQYYKNIPHQTVVKGDTKYYSIAAASILAKHYRDEYMKLLHEIEPQFKWDKNLGYGTKDHFDVIKNHGFSELHHRKSFNPVKTIISERNDG